MNNLQTPSRILVWDLPTRLFHWLLATAFLGAWLTAESERWRDLHALLGYTMLVLVAFRLVWGFVGTRYARFASFVYGPRDVLAYLRGLTNLRAAHCTGHNPVGSWAIYGLLGLVLLVGATGIATFNDAGGHWVEDLHEGTANAMLALVFVHIAGVLAGSVLHRENLVGAMLTGYKAGRADDGIGRPRRIVAMLLLALIAAVWTGVLPLPGMGPGVTMTAIKANPAQSRQNRRNGD